MLFLDTEKALISLCKVFLEIIECEKATYGDAIHKQFFDSNWGHNSSKNWLSRSFWSFLNSQDGDGCTCLLRLFSESGCKVLFQRLLESKHF